VSFYMTKE